MSAAAIESISRPNLLFAVEKALGKLKEQEDRDAVWAYVQQAEKVAAGAWNIDGCRCPVSAVGIDRLREDAKAFAAEFDYWMEANSDDPAIFHVIPARNQEAQRP